jgi:hypothetical protein
MLWLLVTAGALGVLLGLWLRVWVLLAASVALVVTTTVLMTPEQWPPLQASGFILMLLSTLQLAYLVGLLLSGIWARLASSAQISTCRR